MGNMYMEVPTAPQVFEWPGCAPAPQVVFHAHDGTVLYTTPEIKPRANKGARK